VNVKADPREQELKRVLNRLGLFHHVASGDAWALIPTADSSSWKVLTATTLPAESEMIRSQFGDLLSAYRAADESLFERLSLQLRTAIAHEGSHSAEIENKVFAEWIFNHLRPFLMAWILYLSGALVGLIGLMGKSRFHENAKKIGLGLSAVAMLSHVVGFGLRCLIAGRPPVTNMYESIVWVSFGIMVFAGVLYYLHRQSLVIVVASALSTLGLIVADSAPALLDSSIQPLVPVLRSNYWLTIHVLTITLGYAAFALTLGLGNVTLFQFVRARGEGSAARIANLNQLTYRAMQFGVVLLAAGTILGGVWADYSWGRFWGWDPKEVWALIALLTYLIILHGRYTGWVSQFSYAIYTVLAFMSVVMAWYGVNFVLGVGLHSYGFSSGGRAWVATFVALQLTYVGMVAVLRKTRVAVGASG
jgi:cytochrome c-type biogenesis protein CcsB